MINFIMSLLLGMFPEVLYFTLFLIFTKNLKDKRLKLFTLLAIGYVLLIMIFRYQLLFYIAYIVYTYLVIKKLYKAHISDIFVISIAGAYLTLISFLSFNVTNVYAINYILNRLALFIPLLGVNKNLNKSYKEYIGLWNRKEGNKIKSITLRNVSLVLMNAFIILLSIAVLYSLTDYTHIIP